MISFPVSVQPPASTHQIEAAKNFEQFFFKQVLKSIWKENISLFGENISSEIFKDFWIDALSQSCASKSLGIVKKFAHKIGPSWKGIPKQASIKGNHYDKSV